MHSYTLQTYMGQLSIVRDDKATIPCNMKNKDCAQFVLDVAAGATVLNADGTHWVYSAQAVRDLGLTPPA